MNILYLAHRIPYPPNKGDKIRSFHQIEYLSKRHTVHLACMIDDPEDLQHIKTLEKYCASVEAVYRNQNVSKFLSLSGFFVQKPLSVSSFYSKELRTKIEKKLQSAKIDQTIVFSSVMAEYVRHIDEIPKIMDFVDVDSDKWQLYAGAYHFPMSWVYRLEAKRLALYEEEIARTFDHSIFVTEKEAELFKRRVNDRPISVIPNGVDLEYFSPESCQGSYISTRHSILRCDVPVLSPQSSVLQSKSSNLRPSSPIIVFTGAMDYFPNVDAVLYFSKEIFPLMRKQIPKIQFTIVGRKPTRDVRELGSQRNVVVTGSVDDIRPYLSQAEVAVAPFRISRGIPNKILEAMAMGLPVVGTSTAFQGIQAKETDGIRIGDDPDKFAMELCRLLQDSELRCQCSADARRYVERCHRWEVHGAQLESIMQEIKS